MTILAFQKMARVKRQGWRRVSSIDRRSQLERMLLNQMSERTAP